MSAPILQIRLLPGVYSVCRLAADAGLPAWALEGGLYSVTRTPDELSVVCAAERVPAGVRCESGWRVLQLAGPFAFDQVGVLLAVLAPLARVGVSIFALSTFDTDAVLVKEASLAGALTALEEAGHAIVVIKVVDGL